MNTNTQLSANGHTFKELFKVDNNSIVRAENEKHAKILYVEDSISIRTLVAHSLSADLHVTAFESGHDALAFLQKGDLPDIIITDLNMPAMNGLDLLKQIKCSPFFNSIPVIVLSSEEGTDIRIKCLEAGADDYILKPFSTLELQARINVVLRRSGYSAFAA